MFALSTVSLIMFLALLSALGNGLLVSRVRATSNPVHQRFGSTHIPHSECAVSILSPGTFGGARPATQKIGSGIRFAVPAPVSQKGFDQRFPATEWTWLDKFSIFTGEHEQTIASARARRQVATDERNQREAPNKKEEESVS
jgi:hypothetical protein